MKDIPASPKPPTFPINQGRNSLPIRSPALGLKWEAGYISIVAEVGNGAADDRVEVPASADNGAVVASCKVVLILSFKYNGELGYDKVRSSLCVKLGISSFGLTRI